jgi:hypothetical protein
MKWRYIGWFVMGFATHGILMAAVQLDWSMFGTYVCVFVGSALVSFAIRKTRGMTHDG